MFIVSFLSMFRSFLMFIKTEKMKDFITHCDSIHYRDFQTIISFY